jgi:hypothetical protein
LVLQLQALLAWQLGPQPRVQAPARESALLPQVLQAQRLVKWAEQQQLPEQA